MNERLLVAVGHPEPVVPVSLGVSDATWRTKVSEERTRGVRSEAYGDLRSCACSGLPAWCSPGCAGSPLRLFWRPIKALLRCRGGANPAMTFGIGVIDGASVSPGAWGVDERCDKATTRCRYEPCRVTASSSRLMLEKLAARAVASSVGRFRR
jgi:hypothetical protein